VTTQHRQTFTDAERMELCSHVQLAGEVIARYWPMRTFIHHNPLHGLERLHFDEAVKRGTQLFSGRGYLSNEIFRRYVKHGRIPEDLRARAFLHSYDHRQDASGKLLETIMTAPLVVAQWINMEHYFSTVDNEVNGSGSKVYHNVAGRIGVMTGVWSDLHIRRPAQTVWNGREPYHEPLRLPAVIEAPRDRIRAIINRQPLLEQLFDRGVAHAHGTGTPGRRVLSVRRHERMDITRRRVA
jgi:uncharacterized protein YbcC (UPF0753/DUF2309 family)